MSSFDDYRKKLQSKYGLIGTTKVEEEKTMQKSSSAASTTANATPVSSSEQSSFDKYREKLRSKYLADKVDSTGVSKWFEDAYGAMEEMQSYNKANASKYDANYGGEAGERIKSLLNSSKDVHDYIYNHADEFENADELKKMLSQYRSNLISFDKGNYDTRKYYSRWASEDEYNKDIESWKEYEAKSNFDLDAGKVELDNLTAQQKDAEKLSFQISQLSTGIQTKKNRLRGFGRYDANAIALEKEIAADEQKLSELKKQYADTYGDSTPDQLKAAVTEKSTFYNTARFIQEGQRLANEAINAPDFEEYAAKGAAIENPTQDEAEGAAYIFGWRPGSKEVGNIVTYSRENAAGIAMGEANGSEMVGNYLYLQMTDDEVSIYNYYLAKYGEEKAQEYLDSIEATINQRAGSKMAEGVDGNFAATAFLGTVAGLDQFRSGIVNNFEDGESYIAPSAIQYASGEIRENLADDGFKLPDWLGGASIAQVGYDAVTTTANMLPSILVSQIPVVGQAAGALTLGASAAGNAYADMINLGYSPGQARTYSVMVGASEAGLQYLLGGISQLGGKVTSGFIAKAVDKVDNAIAKVAIRVGGSMASEGLEESLQTVIEPWLKSIATGVDFEAPNIDEVLYSGLLGAVTSLFLEGTGDVVSSSVTATQTNKIYGENAADLINEALEIDPNNELALRLKAKLDKGKSVSGLSLAEIVEQNEAGMVKNDTAAIKEAAKKRLSDLGETGNVEAISSALAKQATGERLTVDDRQAIRNSKYGQRVANELNVENIQSGQYSSEWAQKIGTERINADEYSRLVAESQINPANIDSTDTINADKNAEIAPETAKSAEPKTTSPVNVLADNSPESVAKAIAAQQANEDADAEGPIRSSITLESASKAYGKQAGAYVSTYNLSPGQDIAKFDDAYRKIYDWGKTGAVPLEYAKKKSSLTNALTEAQREAAYRAGADAKASLAQERERKMKTGAAVRGEAKPKIKNGRKVGVVKLGNITMSELKAIEKEDGSQGKQINMLRFLAEATGRDIILVKSKVGKDGKYRLSDKEDYQGKFSWRDGNIYIDVNAGLLEEGDTTYTLINTFTHEFVHTIERDNATGYNELRDVVFAELRARGYGKIVDDLINKQGADENGNPILEYDASSREVVAESLAYILRDSHFIENLANNHKSLFEQLLDRLKDFVKNLRGYFKNLSENPKIYAGAKVLQDNIDGALRYAENIIEVFDRVALQSVENYQAAAVAEVVQDQQMLAEAGIGLDVENHEAYALRHSPAYTDVIKVGKKDFDVEGIAKAVANGTGRSYEDALKWVQSEMAIANIIMGNPEFLDFEPDSRYEAIKKNSDYPQGTVDLSNLCPKRTEFTAMFDMLQKKYPDKLFTASDVAAMRNILKENDITVACGACFVEDRRQLLGEIADTYIGMWKEAVETGKPLQKTNAAGNKVTLNVTKALAKQYGLTAGAQILAADKYIPTQYDLTTYEGFKLLEKNHPTVALGFIRYNNSRGQQAGRLIEGRAEYNRQILGWSEAKVKNVNNNGGLRIFSFSDFEVVHLLDLVQVIIDCAAMGVKIQGYTKIPAFSRLIRDTGIKINRSLIPKGQTGMKMVDGKQVLDYDTTEGIDINDENFLDEKDNPNVGNIIIGINPTQIGIAMLDDFIDYIIPFHTNKSKDICKALGLAEWVNYKESQHEKDIATGKASKHNVNIYTQVINKYHPTNKVEFVNAFLKECKRQGKIPRYSEFLNVDENGDFTYREGYHKLLVDFKMFDSEGNILPQGEITPNLDDAFMRDLLQAEVDKKQSYEFPQKVYDQIEEQFGDDTSDGSRYQYMSRDVLENVDPPSREESKTIDMLDIRNLARYYSEVYSAFDGKLPSGQMLLVGKTPDLLVKYGASDGPLYLPQRAIKKNKPGEKHGLGEAVIYGLPEELHDPLAITGQTTKHVEQGDDGIVVWTNWKDAEENSVVVPIRVDPVNFLGEKANIATTVFDLNTEEYFDDLLREGNIKYTKNNESIPQLLSQRRYVPKAMASSAFNRIMKEYSEFVKSKSKIPSSDTDIEQHQPRSNLRQPAPVFYSKMARVVDGMKQEKFGASSVISMLTDPKRGVKAEEIKWSGIEEFLEGKKSVTKAELLEFIAGSSLQIEEVVRDDREIPISEYNQERISAYEKERDGVVDELKSEWKRVFGKDIPIQYFGSGLEHEVVSAILEAERDVKNSQDVGKAMESAREGLKKMFDKNYLNFGYDSSKQAYKEFIRDTETFMLDNENYLSSEEEQAIDRFIKARSAFRSAEGVSLADKRALKDIAEKADGINNLISKVKKDNYKEAAKYNTKWKRYSLEGGENYREILFSLPNSTYTNSSMEVHWGEENKGILAHARIQDLSADGGKMLFIEEIQSDWHNDGGKSGYQDYAKLKELEAKANEAFFALEDYSTELTGLAGEYHAVAKTQKGRELLRAKMRAEEEYKKAEANFDSQAPDAPFRDNYHEFVLKRLLRIAAEEGYDSIGWTTSDVQMKRWNPDRRTNAEMGLESKNPDAVAFEKGYLIEYDQEMVGFLRRYGKKWGATVGKTELDAGETVGYSTDDGKVFTSMIDAIRHLQESAEETLGYKPQHYTTKGKDGATEVSDENGVILGTIKRVKKTSVWTMPITEAMKESVIYEGQEQYQSRDYLQAGTKAVMTTERIDDLIEDSGAGRRVDYANYWITSISPTDFLNLTTTAKIQDRAIFDKMPSEWNDDSTMDTYDYLGELEKNRQTPYLAIDIDTGKVVGHEGRHRMRALERKGIKSAEIQVEFRDDDGRIVKYSPDGKRLRVKDSVTLINQFGTEQTAAITNVIPLNEDYRSMIFANYGEKFAQDGDVQYQERTRSISDRQLLQMAASEIDIEGLTEGEKEALRIFNERLAKLSKLQEERSAQWKSFFQQKNKDKAEATKTRNRIKVLDDQIKKANDAVLDVEEKSVLRSVLKKAREIIEAQDKEAFDAKIKRIRERRNNSTQIRDYRERIRRTIRALDKVLNKGNKKQNVKEGMQEFVSKALKSADVLFTDEYNDEDMIRNGVGTQMTEKEAKQMEVAKQVLAEIDGLRGQLANMTDAAAMLPIQNKLEELKPKLDYRRSQLRDVFARERTRINSAPADQLLADLAREYKKLQESEHGYIASAYQDSVYEFLNNLQQNLESKVVSDMTAAELAELYSAYTMVLTTVRDANKAFAADIKETIEQLGNRTMFEVHKEGKDVKKRTKASQAVSSFSWNNTKPIYAFERIGSSTLTRLYNNIANGENVYAVDVEAAKDFVLKTKKKHGYTAWDLEKTYEFTSSSGMTFNLNLSQIMSIYAYSKREAAHDHLTKGGFVFSDKTEVIVNKLGIPVTYLNEDATAYNVSDELVAEIVSDKYMTKEQRDFVDEMQDYLSNVVGENGNEVSMKLFGVKLFGEEHYFPLRSSGAYLTKAKEAELKKEQGQISLVNSGFTKATTPKASNPIVLEGFMDVWSDHVNDMSLYHAFVLPLEDFRRVYNYNSPHVEEGKSMSVDSAIRNAQGRAASQYIDHLLRDINGGTVVDPRSIGKGWVSKFKKAAVVASMSVVVQQPTAMFRAMAYIDRKYFGVSPMVTGVGRALGNVFTKAHTKAWEEVKTYAPGVAIIKEIGGFDTSTGQGITDYLRTNEYEKGKLKALFKDKQYRRAKTDEVLGKLPAMADELAWVEIWNAVKRETKARNKGMDVTSEEFLKIAGERFTEVIRKTQVYDSVFTKSSFMRSKNEIMAMMTSFMAEPTTTLNMMEDAVRKLVKGNWKQAARVTASVATSIIINNILRSIVYAMRDDDDDETFAEKYAEALTSGLIDDVTPFNYYPFLRDIWSLAQGYDVERADMTVISTVLEAMDKAKDTWFKDTSEMDEVELAEHEKACLEVGWNIVVAAASMFGLPLKNISRDVMGAFNTYDTISKDVAGRDTTLLSWWDTVKEAALNSLPELIRPETPSKREKLYNAILAGDDAYVERMSSGYTSEDAYHSALRQALRENDPRIKEAALARFGGDFNTYSRIAKQIIAERNFTQNDIVAAINSELNKLKPDDGSDSPQKLTGLYKAEDFAMAVSTGDWTNAAAIKTDIVNTHMANGKDKDEAEKSFRSSAKSECKDMFILGDITESEAIKAMTSYMGLTDKEAKADVQYWNFTSKYPDIYADDSWFDAYYEKVESSGLDIGVYMNYRNQVKDVDGKDKKVRRMAVINSLPITSAQKDALYYAEGWTQSKIHEAPWR